MNSRMLLVITVTSILLVSFAFSPSSAKSSSIQGIVQASLSNSKNKSLKKYVWIPGSSFSFGEVLILEEGSVHKDAAQCFNEAPTTKWENYDFEENYDVWTRSLPGAVLEALQGIIIKFSAPAKESGKLVEGEITLKPSEKADKILAAVSFTGTREEISPRALVNYSLKFPWSNDCLSNVPSQHSYVVVDVLRGLVRIQFAEEIRGKQTPIKYIRPSSWKKVIVDGEETGEFEQEATFIIARQLKIKSKGSSVTWMRLEKHLRPLF